MARLNRDAVQLVAEALHEGCADRRTSWVQAWRATRVLLSVCTDWWAGVEAHLKCHLQQLAGCALRPPRPLLPNTLALLHSVDVCSLLYETVRSIDAQEPVARTLAAYFPCHPCVRRWP